MPVNGFTVGRDLVVTMAGPGGQSIVIDSDQVTHFEAKPLKRDDWSRPLNVPPQPIYIPDGWRGTVEIDRSDATLDTFQTTQEANFWNGQNIRSSTILETITEDDGSVTQFQFINVMYWIEEPGTFKADGKVMQRIDFCAGQRKRVS